MFAFIEYNHLFYHYEEEEKMNAWNNLFISEICAHVCVENTNFPSQNCNIYHPPRFSRLKYSKLSNKYGVYFRILDENRSYSGNR